MSCKKPDVSDKLILFVDGSLPDQERRKVEAHLSTCPQCRVELEDLKEIVGTLAVTSKHVRGRWTHPSPEELYNLIYSPREIDREKRLELQSHVKFCKECGKEMAMMKEAPPLEDVEVRETAAMPRRLLKVFQRLYGKNEPVSPIKFSSLKTPTFWEWLTGSIHRQVRLAHMSMAGILVLTIFLVIIFGALSKTDVQDSGMERYAENVKFRELPSSLIATDDRKDFLEYLRANGVQAREKDDSILIERGQEDRAFILLARYKEKVFLASGKQILPVAPDKKSFPAMRVGKGAGSATPSQDESSTLTEFGQAPPDIETALDKMHDYPQGSPMPGKTLSTPGEEEPQEPSIRHDKEKAPGKTTAKKRDGISDDGKGLEARRKDKNGPRDKGKEKEEKPKPESGILTADASGEKKTAAPIPPPMPVPMPPGMARTISASTKGEGAEGPKLLTGHSSESSPLEVLGTDMEEREKATGKIQGELKDRISKFLETTKVAKDFKVKVYATLSFEKDEKGEYKTKGVTVIIEHPVFLTQEEKNQIKENVRLELKWKNEFDETILFVEKNRQE